MCSAQFIHQSKYTAQLDLKKVVDEVNKISHKTFRRTRSDRARLWKYFLKSFAVNATKEDGEFYTPHDIVELIAAFIERFRRHAL